MVPELTPEQAARVAYLARDEWIVDTGESDDEAKSWENFRSTLEVMSSIELHQFVQNFNWDGGVDELSCVLEHPNCDTGTALLIFWLAGPVFFYRRALRGKLTEVHDRERYEFLTNIQKRIENGSFPSSVIAVDPISMFGTGSNVARQYIPEKMFQTTAGEPVARQSLK